MQILGLSGSLRRDSHNTRLLAGARTLLPSGVELVIFDQLAEIPPYSEDDEHEPSPCGPRPDGGDRRRGRPARGHA